MARLLLGVSGGIAAYKALETARLAVKAGYAVRVVQTRASERFVGRASFEAITGAPVLLEEFDADPLRGAYPGEPAPSRLPISHLALVQRADVFLIAPASANTIAKLAHGHADNLLTAAALAADCPVVIAPAMNDRMYRHPATQDNIEQLRRRGVVVIAPGEGELASHGEHGLGRLAEPAELLEACRALLDTAGSWSGLRVLVSAGGTREPIDSVRYIGNRSSGRMGVALARRAAARGADVTLVAAHLAVPAPGLRVVSVGTAAELLEACRKEFPLADVLLMAAAVADFRPATPVEHKLKKENGLPEPIALEPTEDVLSALAAARRPGQVLVGFAAEHGHQAVEFGRTKLERKSVDLVVVNDVSRPGIGFDSADNEVVLISADGERQVARGPKEEVADAVLDEVQRVREGNEDGSARAHPRSTAGV
ncbi:MAG: bifunctional phosphopantothenoylcysteine decarboxylase/phosphopantothenate--cysteine ligase CoaBC [Solirubrobacteraceae bacterium]